MCFLKNLEHTFLSQSIVFMARGERAGRCRGGGAQLTTKPIRYSLACFASLRFSQPTNSAPPAVSNSDLFNLMTPLQALSDAKHLVQSKQSELKCSTNKSSPDYCPVIVIGGSYPGFLSFSMRLLHSDVIDASYTASAPIRFYAQQVSDEIPRKAKDGYIH